VKDALSNKIVPLLLGSIGNRTQLSRRTLASVFAEPIQGRMHMLHRAAMAHGCIDYKRAIPVPAQRLESGTKRDPTVVLTAGRRPFQRTALSMSALPLE